MEPNTLEIAGQIAGIGGLAIGALVLIFRDVIAKNIFPNLNKHQAFSLLRLVVILTWFVAIVGIGAWVYVSVASPEQSTIQSIPEPGKELEFRTESVESADAETQKIYFTVWNKHPADSIRVNDIYIEELQRILTVAYCCPETRSPLKLHLDLDSPQDGNSAAPDETFLIPPRSSHTFVAITRVERGFADNNPVVYYGLIASYSTLSHGDFLARSDRIYVANYTPLANQALTKEGLASLLSSDDFLARSTSPSIVGWFP